MKPRSALCVQRSSFCPLFETFHAEGFHTKSAKDTKGTTKKLKSWILALCVQRSSYCPLCETFHAEEFHTKSAKDTKGTKKQLIS